MIFGKNFWNNIAKEYNSGRTKGRQFILDPALMKMIGDVKGMRILDVGCGDGTLILALAQKRAICTGIDFSEKLIELARLRTKELNLDVDFEVTDAREFETEAKFDMALVTLLFPHLNSISDISKVIANLSQSLKPNGKLIIGEPHPAFDFYMRGKLRTGDFDYFKSGLPYTFEMKIKGRTLTSKAYHWTIEDYTSVLNSNGFLISRVIEPQPSDEAKRIDADWFNQRSKFPSYIIFDCKKTRA